MRLTSFPADSERRKLASRRRVRWGSEDADMMRPIVVTPRETMDFMIMPGMNGIDSRI
jgi:hypothetical protein